jgi:hypothetical protein
MAAKTPTTELVLGLLEAVGLYALNELKGIQSTVRHQSFETLARNVVDETYLTGLRESGIATIGNRGIRLPEKRVDGVSWAPILWIVETSRGDHRLQMVIAGNGRPFGYRWEPPEGATAPDHDFWHAQPITAIKIAAQPAVTFGGGDISTRVPMFPIDARDRLSLLDALLVSIYGPAYLERYVNDSALRQSIQKGTLDRFWAKRRVAQSKSAKAVGVKKPLPRGTKKKSK